MKIYWQIKEKWLAIQKITAKTCITLRQLPLARLYGVWQRDCLPDTFVFKTSAIEKPIFRVSRWISGLYIKQIYKEYHWTPFYAQITLRGREYQFPVARMFLRIFSPKQCAETSVHKSSHLPPPPPPPVTKIYNYWLVMRATYHMLPESPVNNCFVIPSLVKDKV